MNEQMTSIGQLMKAARKFKKFNQSDVAQAIGCSQSALSKMEHNLLIPNAPQWFLFARFTTIPPETIELGIIDRHSRVKLNNDSVSLGFKLPKRYRLNRAQKIREVYPFMVYLEKKMDPDDYKRFLESTAIDPEFFLDFDNLVSFQIIVDVINFYIRMGKKSSEFIRDLVNYGQNHLYWDRYGEEWKTLKGSKELLSEFSKEQACFQGDFSMKVEYVKNALMVAYMPESHVYHFLKDVTDETKQWLMLYRKFTLQNLVYRTFGMVIEARPVPEQGTSPLENHFEII